MISLLILISVLCSLIIFLELRRSPTAPVVTVPLFISCSRPSERKEIGCWLFTISLWNREGLPLKVDRMEVLAPNGERSSVLPPPEDHPRAAVFHQGLRFPIDLLPQASLIVLASVASPAPVPMETPERCLLRVYAGGDFRDYPLFRMSFS